MHQHKIDSILGRDDKSSAEAESRYKINNSRNPPDSTIGMPKSRKQKDRLHQQNMKKVASIYNNSVSLSPIKVYQPSAERRLYNVDSKKILSMRRHGNTPANGHNMSLQPNLKLPQILGTKSTINATKLT